MDHRHVVATEEGCYSVQWDSANAVVFVEISGFWTEDVGRRFYAAMARALEPARARHGHALILFDARKLPVQADAVAKDAGGQKPFVAAGDRIAFITSSQLLKMQMKRLDPLGEAQYFDNVPSAEKWLLAPAH